MTQTDRDRLVTLRKAQDKRIRQRQAAEELEVSERQVRRVLAKMRTVGDGALVHGLRGRQSNRRIAEEKRQGVIGILKQDVYRGFGPTLASEYLAKKHRIVVSKETVRKWMREGGLADAPATCRADPHVEAAAGAVGRVGAVGHQRARLAGRARREDLSDQDD